MDAIIALRDSRGGLLRQKDHSLNFPFLESDSYARLCGEYLVGEYMLRNELVELGLLFLLLGVVLVVIVGVELVLFDAL